MTSRGQARVAQVLPPGERGESVRVRFSDHVVREGPVPAGGHGPVRVGNVEGVAELDDACIFHAAAVRPVCAGAEYRLVAGALEMESVGAGGQPEPDHMVLVVACRPVQHVENAVVQDDARVAYDQILPRMGGMRRENGVSPVTEQFHYLKMNNRIALKTSRPPAITR